MKHSELFTKTLKEAPKSAVSLNHQLLIRAGFVDQLQSGVYTFLPLGLKVLRKVEDIIRRKMIEIEGQEILMPVLHPKDNWQKTGRWETLDDLFRFTSYYTKTELALGNTHEEIISPLAKKFIISYKDLPRYIFQIQTKFRDEKRAKSGLLRGREFSMKDLYSFHSDGKDLDKYYETAKKAYFEIYKELGIGKETYFTFASGGTFSKFSHEYQTLSEAGEDIIHICEKCAIAVNEEIIDEQKVCPDCGGKLSRKEKAIEVGNTFKLKDTYSKPFNLMYTDKKGKNHFVIMGCYGMGSSRTMGAIVEVNHDRDGIIWPRSVAPFDVYLINLGNTKREAEKVYKELEKNSIDVLWDDREEASAGEKFKDSDLIGIPVRVVISEKNLVKKKIEIKERSSKKSNFVSKNSIVSEIKKML